MSNFDPLMDLAKAEKTVGMTPYFDESEIVLAWHLWLEPIENYRRIHWPNSYFIGLRWDIESLSDPQFPFNQQDPMWDYTKNFLFSRITTSQFKTLSPRN